jgi:hypothetical protein
LQICEQDWRENMLNVHLICHSHEDLGWLRDVDEYFYGGGGLDQSIFISSEWCLARKSANIRYGVQYILNTVLHELQADRRRRFSYAETGFFWRWWLEQKDHVQVEDMWSTWSTLLPCAGADESTSALGSDGVHWWRLGAE